MTIAFFLISFSVFAQSTSGSAKWTVSTAAEAQAYTQQLSADFRQLADVYSQRQFPQACESVTKLNEKLKGTKVIGNFKNASRLVYRIEWYLNPEVDFSAICKKIYKPAVYNFLKQHELSLKNLKF